MISDDLFSEESSNFYTQQLGHAIKISLLSTVEMEKILKIWIARNNY